MPVHYRRECASSKSSKGNSAIALSAILCPRVISCLMPKSVSDICMLRPRTGHVRIASSINSRKCSRQQTRTSGQSALTGRQCALSIREQSGTQQHYLNVLLSRQFGATLLHANIGGVADRQAVPGTRRNRLTCALAAEHEATPRWTLLGEVFGQRGKPETAQIGLRWWAIPKYIQLTSSLGSLRGAGRDGRWVSFGIRFETCDSIF